MGILQMVLIALFVYLGSIGSIVGNTAGRSRRRSSSA